MKNDALLKATNPATVFFKGCTTDGEKWDRVGQFAADFVAWLLEEDQRMKLIEKEMQKLRR